MKIIQASKEHSKEILKKVSELVTELSGKPFVVDQTEALIFIEHSINEGKYVAFLAVDESGNATGLVTAGEAGAVYAGGRFGIIHEFYIDPGLRCNGIGKQLIESVKQTAVALNWKRLEVGAPPYPEWQRTKMFYMREGFQEIGPRLKWVVRPTTIADR